MFHLAKQTRKSFAFPEEGKEQVQFTNHRLLIPEIRQGSQVKQRWPLLEADESQWGDTRPTAETQL